MHGDHKINIVQVKIHNITHSRCIVSTKRHPALLRVYGGHESFPSLKDPLLASGDSEGTRACKTMFNSFST